MNRRVSSDYTFKTYYIVIIFLLTKTTRSAEPRLADEAGIKYCFLISTHKSNIESNNFIARLFFFGALHF
jgi:hypothetical protein